MYDQTFPFPGFSKINWQYRGQVLGGVWPGVQCKSSFCGFLFYPTSRVHSLTATLQESEEKRSVSCQRTRYRELRELSVPCGGHEPRGTGNGRDSGVIRQDLVRRPTRLATRGLRYSGERASPTSLTHSFHCYVYQTHFLNCFKKSSFQKIIK